MTSRTVVLVASLSVAGWTGSEDARDPDEKLRDERVSMLDSASAAPTRS